MMGPTIPVICLGCNVIYDRITHSPIRAELDRSCEDCDSEEFILWDYKAKKCPQCEDGIIGESDWGVSIMARFYSTVLLAVPILCPRLHF